MISNAATAAGRRPADDWFTARRFAVLLFVLIFATFPEVLTGRGTFFHRDFALYGYPLAHYFRESFWRGEVPFWTPMSYCGLPFMAQWNTMTLYPPVLFYLLLPLSWSLGIFCLGHFFLAGMGMYFLAFRWTENRFAAAVAGLAYVFSALSLNYLMWPNYIAGAAWMPWLVVAVERAWREGGRRIPIAVAVGAMQILAGAPELILLSWLLLAALLVLEMARDRGGRWRMAGRFVAAGALTGGVTAAQLLPFAELVAHSQRGAGFEDSNWAMPLWGWADFFVPLFGARPTPLGIYVQPGQYFVYCYYLGIGAAVLALLAVWRVREPRVRLLAVLALVALTMALGERALVYTIIRKAIPLLGFIRYPIKFIMLPGFIVPLLAAFYVRHALAQPAADRQRERRRIFFLLGAVIVGIGVLILFAFQSPPEGISWLVAAQSGVTRAVFAALILGGLVLVVRGAREQRGELFLRGGLLLLLWLDVMTMGPRPNPTVPRWVYEPGLARREAGMEPPPVVGDSRPLLRAEAQKNLNLITMSNGVDQVIYDRLGMLGNLNLLDDFPKVVGSYPLYFRELNDVLIALYSTPQPPAGLMDFLAVSQLNAPGRVTEWNFRPSHLPWVTAGQKPVFVDGTNAVPLLCRPDFNPRETVFLPSDARGFVTVSNVSQPKILTNHFSAQRIDIEIEAAEPALVVVAQSFYRNWHADVDGREVKLLRANHAFQALEVPKGRSRITLVYRDRMFHAGAALSALTLALCVGWFFKQNRRPVATS